MAARFCETLTTQSPPDPVKLNGTDEGLFYSTLVASRELTPGSSCLHSVKRLVLFLCRDLMRLRLSTH